MDRKNIILLVMDTARAQNFPMHGYERNTAPFLSELAEESVTFENAFSQHLWTLPSHVSIFKGKYGFQHRGISSNFYLERNELVKSLKEEGYETRAISNNTYISSEFGWENDFDDFQRIIRDFPFENNNELWNEFSNKDDEYDSSLRKYLDYTKKCLYSRDTKQLINGIYYFLNAKFWIGDSGARVSNNKMREKWNADRPNFQFINYIEPHGPYKPNRKYKDEFLPEDVSREEIFRNITYNPIDALNGDVDLDEKQLKIQEALYDASIKYLDSKLREVYNHLKSKGLLEESYLIITSDHGEYFGEHDLYMHNGGLYPEVIHVPLMIRYPDGRNENVSDPVEIRNLHSFMKEIAEGKTPEMETSEYAFSEYYQGKAGLKKSLKDEVKNKRPKLLKYQVSAQDGDNFLVMTEDGDEEFWDMKKEEIKEEETEKRKEMRERIKKKFSKVMENPESYLPEKNREINEKVKSQLRDLGYVE